MFFRDTCQCEGLQMVDCWRRCLYFGGDFTRGFTVNSSTDSTYIQFVVCTYIHMCIHKYSGV